jgi:hypothetical protein
MSNAIDLPAPSRGILALDRLWDPVPRDVEFTCDDGREHHAGHSLTADAHRVSQSFSRKPPTLSRCLALARERSADVVSALCIELRIKARIRHRRSRPNAGPRRACSRRRGPLVVDIICMTANYRLPRDNITRREQMPVVFGDHIPSSRRASMSAGSTPVSPSSLRSPSVVSRTTFRPRG